MGWFLTKHGRRNRGFTIGFGRLDDFHWNFEKCGGFSKKHLDLIIRNCKTNWTHHQGLSILGGSPCLGIKNLDFGTNHQRWDFTITVEIWQSIAISCSDSTLNHQFDLVIFSRAQMRCGIQYEWIWFRIPKRSARVGRARFPALFAWSLYLSKHITGYAMRTNMWMYIDSIILYIYTCISIYCDYLDFDYILYA